MTANSTGDEYPFSERCWLVPQLLTRFTGGGTDSCLVVSSDKDKNVWEPLATKGKLPMITSL